MELRGTQRLRVRDFHRLDDGTPGDILSGTTSLLLYEKELAYT